MYGWNQQQWMRAFWSHIAWRTPSANHNNAFPSLWNANDDIVTINGFIKEAEKSRAELTLLCWPNLRTTSGFFFYSFTDSFLTRFLTSLRRRMRPTVGRMFIEWHAQCHSELRTSPETIRCVSKFLNPKIQFPMKWNQHSLLLLFEQGMF